MNFAELNCLRDDLKELKKKIKGLEECCSLENNYLLSVNNIPGDSNRNVTITKNDIGLGNVDNTKDIDKPISNPIQQALNNKQDILINGVNIKTINGQSLLGGGNINIDVGELDLVGTFGDPLVEF